MFINLDVFTLDMIDTSSETYKSVHGLKMTDNLSKLLNSIRVTCHDKPNEALLFIKHQGQTEINEVDCPDYMTLNDLGINRFSIISFVFKCVTVWFPHPNNTIACMNLGK